MKNSQRCEYKERKKPGLRAGYGRELEAKLAEQATMIGEFDPVHGGFIEVRIGEQVMMSDQ
jgi:hypothetical protein